jgi:hypothetical protein
MYWSPVCFTPERIKYDTAPTMTSDTIAIFTVVFICFSKG